MANFPSHTHAERGGGGTNIKTNYFATGTQTLKGTWQVWVELYSPICCKPYPGKVKGIFLPRMAEVVKSVSNINQSTVRLPSFENQFCEILLSLGKELGKCAHQWMTNDEKNKRVHQKKTLSVKSARLFFSLFAIHWWVHFPSSFPHVSTSPAVTCLFFLLSLVHLKV